MLICFCMPFAGAQNASRCPELDTMPLRSTSIACTDSIHARVSELCDSLCAGRRSGSLGASRAASLIAHRFEQAGLQPYGGEWYHDFSLADSLSGRNVVGFIPGTSGKYIVLAAYYDGLGTMDGVLYPGADANVSGVVAIELVASLLRRDVRDGVIVVAFDAHHNNYAGAKAFWRELSGSGVKPRLMVNLDTIGSTLAPVRTRRPRSLMVLGGKKYRSVLEESAALGCIDLHFDYYGSERFTRLFYNKLGEHSVFLERGVPAVLFTSGVTFNTNKPSDTPQSLDLEALRSRILCIARFVSSVAGAQ